MSKLSSLEIRRLENIRQNELFLAQLQLENVKPKREVTKRPQSSVVFEKSRHSKRAAKMEPEKYKERLEGYASYSSQLIEGDEELLEMVNLKQSVGIVRTKAVTEYVPRQISTVFIENIDSDFTRFLSDDQLGQAVKGLKLTIAKDVLISLSVVESSDEKIVVNPEMSFSFVLQWKNALYFTNETKQDMTNYFIKRDRLYWKWNLPGRVGKNSVRGMTLFNRLFHAMQHPKDDCILLFNYNASQASTYTSCGRLKVVEYHDINKQFNWSTHWSDNYFIFELLDTDALVQSGVVLFGSQKDSPVKSLETVLQPIEGEPKWTTDNVCVGTKVAKYFMCKINDKGAVPLCVLTIGEAGQEFYTPVPDKFHKLYTGVVTKYAPPSASGKSDQLYHILFSDGDQEDWSVSTYTKGQELYKEHRKGLR